jgi:DNA-binding CsgD family transcriptional regulator
MGIHLSTRKIAQLQAASATLLSPFSYESGDEWRLAVSTAIEPIVDAHGSMFGLDIPHERMLVGVPEVIRPLGPYTPPPDYIRDGYLKAVRTPGFRVVNWSDAYEPMVIKRTEFYNECVRPSGFLAPLMLTARVPGSALGAAVYTFFENETDAADHIEERRLTLQLLVPAFQAGVTAYVAARRQREKLIAFGELSHVATILFDMRGRTVHESGGFEQLVAPDAEPSRIRAEAARLARNLSVIVSSRDPLGYAGHPIKSQVTTRTGRYDLSAFSFEDNFGYATIVGVLVSDLSTGRMDSGRLVSEYHLTKRELQTAALLQRRMPAKEIAAVLGVSVNTARRHTEHVLSKLGVHSRHAAAEKLSGNQT